MIKNTVIIILIILLFIVLYSYYSLSNNMVNYQKDRMKIILEKEKKLNTMEINLDKINTCNRELTKYKNIISVINKSLTELNTANNLEQKKSPESILISEYLNNDEKCDIPLNEQNKTEIETETIPLPEQIILESEIIPSSKQIDIDFNRNIDYIESKLETNMSPNMQHIDIKSNNEQIDFKLDNHHIETELKLNNIKPENNKLMSGVYNKPEDYIKSNKITNEERPRPPFI